MSPPTHMWVALNNQDKLSGVEVVPILELYAMRYGLQMAQQQGSQQVVVESDCMKAIVTLNRTHSDSSAIGMIADDVLQLASTFPMVRFIQVSCLCNGVAHRLAKFALSSNNNLVWFEEPPILIQELLFQDISNSS
ncbi:hypothetical protein D8674_036436 [Pyrus ussuriensis x Pyrus communis]|uniref:RNase H type-1 domain-containing protein n=1 Tax=Pyrus ussuriensis x Pyrus communis TaxID=2448454 RepID=A0A5N5GLH2_9ROSA|nr:hypothetical protein D8674_036436 [Pyrus ussuriensis x Pyrus communis]